LAIEGLRQLERHGGSLMLDRAFDGFLAIAPPDWKKPGVPPSLTPRAFRSGALAVDGPTGSELSLMLAPVSFNHRQARARGGELGGYLEDV
jgi:hypothetical protein